MYSISKEFHFSASHQLNGLPDDHQCARLHGHNYIVRLELTSRDTNPVGFILDYGDLAPFKTYLDEHFDHRHLNDVVPFNPTAEKLAYWLTIQAAELLDPPAGVELSVAVSETPKTWARWYAGEDN